MSEVYNAKCASPQPIGSWNQIDWKRCNNRLKKLQARIVKAMQESKWNRVKALQHMLTRSFTAKALAVKRVTENDGKKTPGVDGIIWSTGKSKFNAISTLKQRGYHPNPLRRIYIPKSGSKKLRPISIPTMTDRAMQTLYKFALEPIAEEIGDNNSYGFRTARSTHDAISQCFNCLAKDTSAQWIIEGDIKGAFDNVCHEWIMENIPISKDILRKFIKSGYIDSGKLYPTEKGTGQGSPISATIFNMVLDGMEHEIKRKAREIGGRDYINPKINFCRYADDFVATGVNKKILVEDILPTIENFLSMRGLHLSETKTVITRIDEGFDFLGWNVRKYKDKLLIKPAKKGTTSFLNRVRKVIKGNKNIAQEDLIKMLNPKIRGWAQYHRRVCAKGTFQWVDYQIWRCLWQWAKRRHPNKGKKWIIKKYFHSIGSRSRVFSTKVKPKIDGINEYLELYQAAATKIKRHVKVKLDLNPFDANWWGYLEARRKKYNVTVDDNQFLFV